MPKTLLLMLAVLLAAGCATHAVTSGRVVVRDDRAATELRITDRDRAVLHEYYRGRSGARQAPPGLARREPPPPGLARRAELPPGLQGRLLPRDLEARLSVLPEAYVRLIIGRDIVLIHRNSRLVHDIVHGVLP